MRNTENDTLFARKVIRPFVGITDVDIQNEVRAVNRLCKTGHPNIVQVLEYGTLKDDAMFFFIDMEHCEASLEEYLRGGISVGGGPTWETVCKDASVMAETGYNILQHIANGLFYIHAMGEAHRDISPHNGFPQYPWPSWANCFLVLFKDGYWKIADFGLPPKRPRINSLQRQQGAEKSPIEHRSS
jgi:serine/threonine protein kinase